MRTLRAIALALSLVVWIGPGCVSYPIAVKQSPDWVERGSGLWRAEEDVFQGVGVASGIQNRLLLRATADNRARSELAAVMVRYVEALAASAGKAGDQDPGVLQPLAQASLNRAVIVDHWIDPDSGRLYALCRLNMASFKDTLAAYRMLPADSRKTMLENAERQHARMLP